MLCGEIFNVPEVLCCVMCGCSFCKCCLSHFWETQGSQECPLCREKSPAPSERTCKEHGVTLTLFCTGDACNICTTCHKSGIHMNHRVYPLKEALEDCKVGKITKAEHCMTTYINYYFKKGGFGVLDGPSSSSVSSKECAEENLWSIQRKSRQQAALGTSLLWIVMQMHTH